MNYLFITLRWLDAIDILLVAVLLYRLYYLIKGTAAINIFFGVLLIYSFWLTIKALHMQLLTTILGQFVSVGVVALIILFQQELRRFLLVVGSRGFFNKENFRGLITLQSVDKNRYDNVIIKAVKNMSANKTGALIVITQKTEIKYYVNTGVMIDSELSDNLLETIFFKNNPLHDGAVVISGNRIQAAKVLLPLTENDQFPFALGTRHRAAVGISEQSDALVICVSEQTGDISVARNGNIDTNILPEELKSMLDGLD